jgi:hypothetical protein
LPSFPSWTQIVWGSEVTAWGPVAVSVNVPTLGKLSVAVPAAVVVADAPPPETVSPAPGDCLPSALA